MAQLALNAVVTTATSATYKIDKADTINVTVYSAAGSTASVVVEERMSDTAPWFIVATITDPSATGECWVVPRSRDLRVRVASRAAGTISAEVEGYIDGVPGAVL